MIRDDIKAATIAAMKGGDKDTTATLRIQAARSRDIEARTGGAPKDDDQLVTEVLQKMVKQRRAKIRDKIYRKNGREDRAGAEEAEIAVIDACCRSS